MLHHFLEMADLKLMDRLGLHFRIRDQRIGLFCYLFCKIFLSGIGRIDLDSFYCWNLSLAHHGLMGYDLSASEKSKRRHPLALFVEFRLVHLSTLFIILNLLLFKGE